MATVNNNIIIELDKLSKTASDLAITAGDILSMILVDRDMDFTVRSNGHLQEMLNLSLDFPFRSGDRLTLVTTVGELRELEKSLFDFDKLNEAIGNADEFIVIIDAKSKSFDDDYQFAEHYFPGSVMAMIGTINDAADIQKINRDIINGDLKIVTSDLQTFCKCIIASGYTTVEEKPFAYILEGSTPVRVDQDTDNVPFANKVDNFTAVLPVTCNANCSFCPEKEMDNKMSKDKYINTLVAAINGTTNEEYDHISLSGGEPTIDLRFLKNVVESIRSKTRIKKVGITTNGLFMKNKESLLEFISIAENLSHINVSIHDFDVEKNNAIMSTSSKFTLRDVLRLHSVMCTKYTTDAPNIHVNMVVTEESIENEDFIRNINTFTALSNENEGVRLVLRKDYNCSMDSFSKVIQFLTDIFGEPFITSECPSCKTMDFNESRIYAKYSAFEPTSVEKVNRELILHMNGLLTYDWERKRPYDVDYRNIPELTFDWDSIESDVKAQGTVLTRSKSKPKPKPAKATRSSSSDGCGFSPAGSCGF